MSASSGPPSTPWPAPLAALHQVNAALAQAVTTEEVVQGAFAGVLSALGGGSVGLWLLEDDQTALRLVNFAGQTAEVGEQFGHMPMETALPGPLAVRSRKPVTYGSQEQRDAEWPDLAGLATDMEAVAVLPLIARHACLGCLSVGFAERHDFSDEEISFMAGIADQCALALDRARLFDAEHAARATLEFLSEATRLMVSSLDPEEVLQRLVELAVPRLGDWCAVSVEDEGVLRLVAMRVAGRPEVNEKAVAADPVPVDADVVSALAFRSAEVQVLPEIPEGALTNVAKEPVLAAALAAVPIRSGVVVPIVARGEPIGTLTLMFSETGRSYDSQLRYAAEGFAARAGIALDNAR